MHVMQALSELSNTPAPPLLTVQMTGESGTMCALAHSFSSQQKFCEAAINTNSLYRSEAETQRKEITYSSSDGRGLPGGS